MLQAYIQLLGLAKPVDVVVGEDGVEHTHRRWGETRMHNGVRPDGGGARYLQRAPYHASCPCGFGPETVAGELLAENASARGPAGKQDCRAAQAMAKSVALSASPEFCVQDPAMRPLAFAVELLIGATHPSRTSPSTYAPAVPQNTTT